MTEHDPPKSLHAVLENLPELSLVQVTTPDGAGPGPRTVALQVVTAPMTIEALLQSTAIPSRGDSWTASGAQLLYTGPPSSIMYIDIRLYSPAEPNVWEEERGTPRPITLAGAPTVVGEPEQALPAKYS